MQSDKFHRLIIRKNKAGEWEGVDPVTGRVFTKAKQKN